MNANDICKVVLGVIASVGGIGGVIVLCIKFAAGIIASHLEQKYSLDMQKELENYKAELSRAVEGYKTVLDKELEKYRATLENKNYVTKTRFDTEFSIFRELNKLTFEMVKRANILVPAGYAHVPADESKRKEYEQKNYEICAHATVAMQDYLQQNSPFVPKKFCDLAGELLSLCNQQLEAYAKRFDVLNFAPKEEKERFTSEDYKRARTIIDKYEVLVEEMRNYLSTLDVI